MGREAGGRNPGVMGAGSLREEGEEGAGAGKFDLPSPHPKEVA